jgi:hypothetical protein
MRPVRIHGITAGRLQTGPARRRQPQRLFYWRRQSYARVFYAHAPGTLLSAGVLLAAGFLPVQWLPPKFCLFLALTGYPCPFCGFTRSLWACAEGHWGYAMANCPLACLLYLIVAAVYVFNGAGLLLGLRIRRGAWLRLEDWPWQWVLTGCGFLVLTNWLYRLACGLQ